MTETTVKKLPKLTLHQRYSNWVNDKAPYLVLTGLMMTLILAVLWHRCASHYVRV